MALVNIVNEDFTITITPLPQPWPLGYPNPPAPAGYVPGTPVYTGQLHPSSKVKAGDGILKKPILITRIGWTMFGDCSLAGHTFSPGTGSPMNPVPYAPQQIEKVREIYDPFWSGCPIGKGDYARCSGVFTNNATKATVYCVCTFEVTDAGQTKASGE